MPFTINNSDEIMLQEFLVLDNLQIGTEKLFGSEMQASEIPLVRFIVLLCLESQVFS